MWLQLVSFLLLQISISYAEPPVINSAPYATANWRPSKTLSLRYPQNSGLDVEIIKQRIDYIGSVRSNNHFESTRKQQRKQQYVPLTRSFLKEQELKRQSVKFKIVYPDPSDYDETPVEENRNNKHNAMRNFKDSNAVLSRMGQYFVLSPDNTLQHVAYTTMKDVGSSKGFTAQLKYTPVGEIQYPLYKYNNRGQLMRVLKK